MSPLGSQLRIREVLVVEGADLPVSALLVDDFGNPVDNGLDLLDDAVYLQNVEKKKGKNGDMWVMEYMNVHIWPTKKEKI